MKKVEFDYINGILAYAVWPSFNYDVAVFIACQFALESNFGRSLLASKYNNHCGMKIPSYRFTYCNNEFDVFAHYDSVEDCILDYIVWLAYSRFTQLELGCLDIFLNHLSKSSYCPEKDYIDRINSIYVQFKTYKNGKN